MSKLNRAARGLTFVFGTALVLGIACGSILEANKDAVDSYFKTHSSTLVQKMVENYLMHLHQIKNILLKMVKVIQKKLLKHMKI